MLLHFLIPQRAGVLSRFRSAQEAPYPKGAGGAKQNRQALRCLEGKSAHPAGN